MGPNRRTKTSTNKLVQMKTTTQLTQHLNKLHAILELICRAEERIQFLKDVESNKNWTFYSREEIKEFISNNNKKIERTGLALLRLKKYYLQTSKNIAL